MSKIMNELYLGSQLERDQMLDNDPGYNEFNEAFERIFNKDEKENENESTTE